MEIKPANRNLIDEYIKNCRLQNKSEHTLRNYSSDLKFFVIWFESISSAKLFKITPNDIFKYQDFLTKGGSVTTKKLTLFEKFYFWLKKIKFAVFYNQKPLSVNSKRRKLSSVKNFFDYLTQSPSREKKYKRNPIRPKIHFIRLKDQDVQHTPLLRLKDWEKIDLFTHGAKDRLMIHLLYFAGLRIEELTKLKVSDFDDETGKIRIHRKGGYIHYLKPVKHTEIFEYCRRLKLKHDQYIFSKGNKPISTRALYAKIMRLIRKSKISSKISPHSFRKACATNLYYQTKDLLAVRDYLNHKDAKVTQTYIETNVEINDNYLRNY